MTEKRFQLFVSSTFEDLKDERKQIQEAILRLDHFPAGMEGFPAADDSAWELIKQVIDTSDYYLLIIAGRYGSQDDQGISYTEKEYNYALESQKPVIAFIHGDQKKIPIEHVERNEVDREKLQTFIERVKSKHHCKFWKNRDELQSAIYPAIQQLIKTKPALGWTRQAVGPSVEELNRRLVELQSKFDACSAELDLVRHPTADMVLSGEVEIKYNVFEKEVVLESRSFYLGWDKVFWLLGSRFANGLTHTQFIVEDLMPRPSETFLRFVPVNEYEGQKIVAHLFGAGLVDSYHRDYSDSSLSRITGHTVQRKETVWVFTDLGKKLYYAMVAAETP